MHVEALQTTDIDALIVHIADVLETSMQLIGVTETHAAAMDLHQRQETMVFYYFASLMQQIENIEESRY
jgi:hypothetical protein